MCARTASLLTLWIVAVLIVVLAAAPVQAAAPFASPDQPISLDAASSDFDYRNNRLVFRKVRILQGEMSVAADEATATGLEFQNSQWVFTGAVQIRLPNGALDSDSATITFHNNQITQAVIAGTPATFEQRREQQALARGRAGNMAYDVTKGTIELTGQAWLTDGQNEITGETLVYDIGRERVYANPGEQDPGGVSITINPRSVTPPPRPPPEQAP